MSYMDEMQFRRYLYAEEELKSLIQEQNLSLRRAYNDIHPTRTYVDHEVGKLYSQSINVENYAIWLAELQGTMERQRKRVIKRIQLYNKAKESLTEDQRILLKKIKMKDPSLNPKAVKALMEALEYELYIVVSLYEEKQEMLQKAEMKEQIKQMRIETSLADSERSKGKHHVLVKGQFVYMTDEELQAHQKKEQEKFKRNTAN